jgi:hypothetical protein
VFDVFRGVIDDAQTLLIAAISVVAIWFVAWTWFRSKALVPTLGALLLGAIVIFGVTRMPVLTDRVGQDVDRYSNTAPRGRR